MDKSVTVPQDDQARRAEHWRKTRQLTAILLALWFFTGFMTVFFARELLQLTLFGWPLSFYMAAQGSSLIYLGIIGFYALRLRKLDRQYHAQAGNADHADNGAAP